MKAVKERVGVSMCLMILAACATALPQAPSGRMQLLSPGVGWVLGAGKLYWTTDNGTNWTDITPPMSFRGEHIASAFFKDEQSGWVLLAGDVANSANPRFDLASTTDSGADWEVRPVDLSGVRLIPTELYAEGSVFFVDDLHGWLNLGVTSSSNFSSGMLLKTEDGGGTWKRPLHDPFIRGSMFFLTPEIGWLAGGPGGQRLYVTRNGGGTWQQVSLNIPLQITFPVYQVVYGLPRFLNDKRGFLPVTLGGPDTSALAVFVTEDGGLSWRARRVLSGFVGYGLGVAVPSALIDSSVVTARISVGSLALTITDITESGASTVEGSAPQAGARSTSPSISQMSFVTPSEGWVMAGRLLATADGGITWKDVSPWPRLRWTPAAPPSKQTTAGPSANQSTSISEVARSCFITPRLFVPIRLKKPQT